MGLGPEYKQWGARGPTWLVGGAAASAEVARDRPTSVGSRPAAAVGIPSGPTAVAPSAAAAEERGAVAAANRAGEEEEGGAAGLLPPTPWMLLPL